MMDRTEYQDKPLICRTCGAEFTFEAGEQAFFEKRSWSDPIRCPECRRETKRKQRQDEQQGVSQND